MSTTTNTSPDATEEDYDKIIKHMIKSYNLFKKQSQADALMQEGKLTALTEVQNMTIYGMRAKYLDAERKKKAYKTDEKSLEKYKLDVHGKKYPELYSIYTLTEHSINKEKSELNILKATERLMERMDSELENILVTMSIKEEVDNREDDVYPKDVKVRIDNNLCGLKRPGGKRPFPCAQPPVPGSKYCEKHLKQYDQVKFMELFEKNNAAKKAEKPTEAPEDETPTTPSKRPRPGRNPRRKDD